MAARSRLGWSVAGEIGALLDEERVGVCSDSFRHFVAELERGSVLRIHTKNRPRFRFVSKVECKKQKAKVADPRLPWCFSRPGILLAYATGIGANELSRQVCSVRGKVKVQ